MKRQLLAFALGSILLSPATALSADLVGIMKAQTANEHGSIFAKGIMAAGQSLSGAEFVLNDAENDIGKQISQAETMINRGAKVLAIEPVSAEGSQVIASMGKERGVKVFTFNSKFADPSQAVTFIGADNALMGRAQMEFTAEKLGGKGNIVIINGPMGHSAQIGRSDGYKEVLAKYPELKVIREGSADWVSDKAVSLMENYLQSGEQIDAVVAQNDDMAQGAAIAVEDAGKKDSVLISGIDGLSLGIGMVDKGQIQLSVEQGTQCQIDAIVKVASDLLQDKAVDAEYVCSANLITKENVEQFKTAQ